MIWACCNVAAFVVDMALNAKFGKGITNLSEAYDHVSMPAGPAFAIWGIIFAWEAVFLVAQFFESSGIQDLLPVLTPWFCVTQLMQGLWVPLFTKTDPARVGSGGDVWLWVSTVLLLATVPAFLQLVSKLAGLSAGSAAYWFSFGLTINAAWVLLAAGLSVNQAARAVGLEGMSLSFVALAVLSGTVCLELWITGFLGGDRFQSPKAFFPVATWALFWVFRSLSSFPEETSDHAKRLLPLYGSTFIIFYKWCALTLAIVFIVLEVVLCRRKTVEVYGL